MSKAVAIEYGPDGIRCNVIFPGGARPDISRGLADRIPRRRIAEPDECAAVVAFLASDEASHLTGAVVPEGGGWAAGGLQGMWTASYRRLIQSITAARLRADWWIGRVRCLTVDASG